MNIGKYCEMFDSDMRLKNYSEQTRKNYVSQIRVFLKHFEGKASKPSEISENDIKTWLLTAKCINSMSHMHSAIKLFYKLTGKQPLKLRNIEYPRKEKKLPQVLSVEEVQAMFNVCTNLKHKAILSLLYSTGMRLGDLLSLKWESIDRSRMVILIKNGKGFKDRIVPLAPPLLSLLEKYWKMYKSKDYVIEGEKGGMYSGTSVNNVLKQLAFKAGIKKKVWAHQMRHNAFTHMAERGIDINRIQKIAGHRSPKTTQIYTHLSAASISTIDSPLNHISL